MGLNELPFFELKRQFIFIESPPRVFFSNSRRKGQESIVSQLSTHTEFQGRDWFIGFKKRRNLISRFGRAHIFKKKSGADVEKKLNKKAPSRGSININ